MDKVYKVMGAKGNEEREVGDFYETPAVAVEKLLNVEKFTTPILEPACGNGAISRVLTSYAHIGSGEIVSSDLYERGYGEVKDFFDYKEWDGDIITNPPYDKKILLPFVRHAVSLLQPKHKCALLLKLQFLESKSRYEFFKEHPPVRIHVFSERISCLKKGVPAPAAMCYAWYIWEYGNKKTPTVDWI